MSAKQVLKSAIELPANERLDLAEALLDGLDEPDEAIDRAWADEARDRLAAFRRGEVRATALADVLAKYPSR